MPELSDCVPLSYFGMLVTEQNSTPSVFLFNRLHHKAGADHENRLPGPE